MLVVINWFYCLFYLEVLLPSMCHYLFHFIFLFRRQITLKKSDFFSIALSFGRQKSQNLDHRGRNITFLLIEFIWKHLSASISSLLISLCTNYCIICIFDYQLRLLFRPSLGGMNYILKWVLFCSVWPIDIIIAESLWYLQKNHWA